MVVMAFIDIDTKLILNKLMWPAIVVFYAATFLLPERHWYDGLIGAGIGYGLPWLIGTLFYLIRKKEGMGLGDSTLLCAIGALLGWRGVVVSLFGGSVIGVIFTLLAMALGRRGTVQAEDGSEQDTDMMGAEIPFGPYLGAAAMFYMFAEPWIQLNFRLFGG
jgi:leader peptidase (prepilin peptidase)/N-methyltransferase